MRLALATLALALSSAASAQGVFKCKDASGKVSYVAQECTELGLLPGGDLKDMNISKPQAQPPRPAAPPPQAQQKPAVVGETKEAAPSDDAANPNRRCFKTAKGMRCNDQPSGNPEQKVEQK